MNKFIKECPECSKEMSYVSKRGLADSINKNRRCRSCARLGERNPSFGVSYPAWNKGLTKETDDRVAKYAESHKGKIFSDEHKKNISKAKVGTIISKETKQKMSEVKLGKKFSDTHKERISKAHFGKQFSEEHRLNLRKSMIKNIEERYGQIFPNYNPTACKIIDEYGKQNGYNFQHAENDGEYQIKELGYWVDGYDKEKNVVIEYYENYHKKQLQKDKRRKQEIINLLNCKFIELKEWKISREW